MMSRVEEMGYNEAMRRAERREEQYQSLKEASMPQSKKANDLTIIPSQALLDINAPTIAKAEYATVVNGLLSRILAEGDGLKELVKIAQLLDVLGEVEKTLREEVVKHVGEQPMDILGASLRMKALPKRYDYNGDWQLTQIDAKLAALKEERKGRETYLQSLKSEKSEVDESTGEVKKAHPASCVAAGATIAITYRKD